MQRAPGEKNANEIFDLSSGLCFNHLIKAFFCLTSCLFRTLKKKQMLLNYTMKPGSDGADYPEAQNLWRHVNRNVYLVADGTVLCFQAECPWQALEWPTLVPSVPPDSACLSRPRLAAASS